jgi:calcium-dependent protein kinase
MVLAVNYLHTNSIVHRDLKPENIMLYDEGPQTIVKLIDFGIAKQCFNSEQKLNTRSGSPYYVAPEILDGEYDKRVDIWALGIILHSMLVGYPPFRGNND